MNNLEIYIIHFKYYFCEYKKLLYTVEYNEQTLCNEIDALINEINSLELDLHKYNIQVVDKYIKNYSINYLLFLYIKKYDCICLLINIYKYYVDNPDIYINNHMEDINEGIDFYKGACNYLNLVLYYKFKNACNNLNQDLKLIFNHNP